MENFHTSIEYSIAEVSTGAKILETVLVESKIAIKTAHRAG